MTRLVRMLSTLTAVVITLMLGAAAAQASHAWGCYQWSRPSNPFTVTFGDNLSSGWGSYLSTATSDWSKTSGSCNNSSNPIRATVGAGMSRGHCRPTAGRVEVCNGSYGNNGWL